MAGPLRDVVLSLSRRRPGRNYQDDGLDGVAEAHRAVLADSYLGKLVVEP